MIGKVFIVQKDHRALLSILNDKTLRVSRKTQKEAKPNNKYDEEFSIAQINPISQNLHAIERCARSRKFTTMEMSNNSDTKEF